jgi:hypothetical protein
VACEAPRLDRRVAALVFSRCNQQKEAGQCIQQKGQKTFVNYATYAREVFVAPLGAALGVVVGPGRGLPEQRNRYAPFLP